MAHQSPSPLCVVDKSSRADLPRSAGVGNETARTEDFRKEQTVKTAVTVGGGGGYEVQLAIYATNTAL